MNNNADIKTQISSDLPKQKETSEEGSTMKSNNEHLEGDTVNKHAKTSLLRKLRRRFHEHHAKAKEDKSLDSGFETPKPSKKPSRFGSKAQNNPKLSRSNTYNGPFQRVGNSRKDDESKAKS